MKASVRFALVAILLTGCATRPVDRHAFLEWHRAMIRVPLPKKGCFTGTYPKKEWVEVRCAAPIDPRAWMTGNTMVLNPTAEVTSGLISTSIGSFEHAHLPGENTTTSYSLQLNSQQFDSPAACAGAEEPARCKGWQQFVYHPNNSGFIQYWLVNYGSRCPDGWTRWIPHCYRFSTNMIPPGHEPLSDLIHLSLGGTAISGGEDILTLGTLRRRTLHAVNDDNILGLADGWRAAEFGVFGDGNGSQLKFNPGTTIDVKTSVDNGTTNAPNCVLKRETGEKHNLLLVEPCCSYGGEKPSIMFRLSNALDVTPACDGAGDPGR